MNLYIVVEGDRSEARVYPEWIRHINPTLTQVKTLAQLEHNQYYLVSGHGYPNYLEVVKNAVRDINAINSIDRLVVAVDSDDMTVNVKTAELKAAVDSIGTTKDVRYVVQQQCFESWCLGNRKIIQRKPQSAELRSLMQHYNVIDDDPALMTSNTDDLNGSQFAFKYLSLVMQEKSIHYSKRNPKYVADSKYLFHILRRADETSHVSTIRDLRSAVS